MTGPDAVGGGGVTAKPARSRDAAASRQALLEAAQDLFGQLGFERTTVRDIGERAGVDAALIARYFGSKADLYIAAVAAERMGDQSTVGLPGAGADGPDPDGPGRPARARGHPPGPGPFGHPDEIRTAAQARLARRLVEPLVAGMDGDGVDRPRLRAEIGRLGPRGRGPRPVAGVVRRAGFGAGGRGG